MFYIGGCGQIIEAVTFARCAFIFALRNIALGGYLDTSRNIKFYNNYGTTYGLKHNSTKNYIISGPLNALEILYYIRAIERTRKLASLAII